MLDNIEMESNKLLGVGRASPGIMDFIRQERKFILHCPDILSPSELEELDIWTSLLSAASRYPMALFTYDIEEKLKLCQRMETLLKDMEDRNK